MCVTHHWSEVTVLYVQLYPLLLIHLIKNYSKSATLVLGSGTVLVPVMILNIHIGGIGDRVQASLQLYRHKLLWGLSE